MNNIITENYVSFEISKLLKEKGFDVHCDSYYEEDKSLHQFVGNYNSEDQKKEMPHYSRPTHSICIKWIKENFKIYIDILTNSEDFSQNVNAKICWTYWIFRPVDVEIHSSNFNTSEEATEAALKFVLSNLI